MKFKRGIFPEQRQGQEGEAKEVGGLRCRPGQEKDTRKETKPERGVGAGSHDGNFIGN